MKANTYSNIAYLCIYYTIKDESDPESKDVFDIASFYVYNTRSQYTAYISEAETFNTKGLGKYMLCYTIKYLQENTSWFDKDSKVILIAQGDECRDISDYNKYTIDECLKILRAKVKTHNELFFELVSTAFSEEFKHILGLNDEDDIDTYDQQNKSEADSAVNQILEQKRKIMIKH